MAHGAEAPRSGIRVIRAVRIPVRDGVRLAATLLSFAKTQSGGTSG
jgi:predicted acyl esterase